MGTHDAIVRAAVQAWTVGGVPARCAVGGERISDVRDGGETRKRPYRQGGQQGGGQWRFSGR